MQLIQQDFEPESELYAEYFTFPRPMLGKSFYSPDNVEMVGYK